MLQRLRLQDGAIVFALQKPLQRNSFLLGDNSPRQQREVSRRDNPRINFNATSIKTMIDWVAEGGSAGLLSRPRLPSTDQILGNNESVEAYTNNIYTRYS